MKNTGAHFTRFGRPTKRVDFYIEISKKPNRLD